MDAAIQALTAGVQWWDDHNLYVLCPSCDEIHHHGFDGNYKRRHFRVAHCDPIRNGKSRSLNYEIKFPIGGRPGNAAYEIDKTNMRFVAGGAYVPQDEVLSDDEADRLRAAFKERIETKPKWTDAVETELIFDDFSLRRIVNATSQMVKGKLKYIREYLETSPDAEIFLHGVESWELPPHHSSEEDEDGEAPSAEDNVVKTSGTTALHMAACEAYPPMVELLLSKGADANAADVDGRTALMEAALWGRLENVEVLLKYGADKSLTCVDGHRLLRAADFAKALRENAQLRRIRAGGNSKSEPIYKEDTYARDRDRRDIVRLLDDAVDELVFPQLDGFAFWPTLGDSTSLSLTTQYSLPNKRKAVARMHRGGGLPDVSAMSGWSHMQNKSIQVAGRDWTDEVLQLCELIGFTPAPDKYDQGLSGRFNACHAEKQLIAYFVHKHLVLPHELDIPEESEDDLEELIGLLSMGELADGALERRQRDQAQKKMKRAYRTRLEELWEARPNSYLREAVIIVSRPVCGDCERFVARVNGAFGLAMLVRHNCLDPLCRECRR